MGARVSSDFFVVLQTNRSTNASPALGILWLLPYTPDRALFNPHSHEQGRIPIFLGARCKAGLVAAVTTFKYMGA